eukprot:3480218-Rhodomonas_salina.3
MRAPENTWDPETTFSVNTKPAALAHAAPDYNSSSTGSSPYRQSDLRLLPGTELEFSGHGRQLARRAGEAVEYESAGHNEPAPRYKLVRIR